MIEVSNCPECNHFPTQFIATDGGVKHRAIVLDQPITVRELQDQVHAFAEHTFGPGREDSAWKKLFEEIGETLKNPRDPGEWADIFIVLLDLAKMYGVDVGEASVAKMEVNRARRWTKTETGVMQHIPGTGEPDTVGGRTDVPGVALSGRPLAVADPPPMVAAPGYYASFHGGPYDGTVWAGSLPPGLWFPGGPGQGGYYDSTDPTDIEYEVGSTTIHYTWNPGEPE